MIFRAAHFKHKLICFYVNLDYSKIIRANNWMEKLVIYCIFIQIKEAVIKLNEYI